ncbi:MAG: hypothetical protein BroJett018_52490 [Chloroflexota bacterium]|nr:MAG: hypothetical protein BroJett018_52490 [Chloroflexota bacterium]
MTQPIEDLKTALANTHDLHQRVDLLNNLARQYLFVDPRQMLDYAEQAHALLKSAPDNPYIPGLARSLENIALARLYMGQPDTALPLFHEGLQLLEQLGDEALIVSALGPIGRCYSMVSDYPQALAYHIQQLRLAEKLKDATQIIVACIGIGTVYFEMGQHEQAIPHFIRSLELARAQASIEWQLTSLNDLAEAYAHLGDTANGLPLALEAMQIAEQSQRVHVLVAVRCTLALLYRLLGRGDEALALMQANLTVLDEIPQLVNIHRQTYRLLGQLAMDKGDYRAAIAHFERMLDYSRQLHNKVYEYEALELLSQGYEGAGDLPMALEYHKKFHHLKSEVFNDRADQRIKTLEAAYNMEVARRESDLLLAQNAELVARVMERTRELEEGLHRERQLKQELEVAAAAKSELVNLKGQIIANVSHEFRTPLAVINTSVELLVEHYERLKPEKRAEIHKRIHDSVFYLTDLLRDVMVVERAQTENVHPDPMRYRFGDFWRQLEEQVRRELGSPATVTFDYNLADETDMTADFVMVKQVVFNLLSNAIKYSPKGAPVQTLITHNTNHWTLLVADHGIGIPADETERIFELFYRGSNVETRRGLGLGTYIVRRYVTAMGGIVSARSPGPGRGTTFEVRVPLHILPS